MSTDKPSDLIELPEAAQLLGSESVGIVNLIQSGRITVTTVNRTLMVSRQQVIALRFRAAGLVPASEWDGPDTAA